MSTMTASPGRVARAVRAWQSPIGKKALMAVSGVIFCGYVLAHMAGNLQFFAGEAKINGYAYFLHHTPALLWGARIVLIAALIVHVWAAVTLSAMSRAARPVGYRMRRAIGSSYASRSMLLSGVILLAFVVFHILHLTTGTVHPDYQELKPYHNLITGFHVIPVAIGYIVAMLALAMHLFHGFYSMFQSLGLTHPSYTPRIRALATIFSFVVVAGFLTIPIAVLAGVVK